MFFKQFILFIYIVSSQSFAASNGVLGGTSTGDSAVSVEITKQIVVRRFNNITRTFTGSGNLSRGDNISVSTNYGTDATRLYTVTLSGSGIGGAFTATNGVDILPYRAFYNDNTGGNSGSVEVTSGTPLTSQTRANGTLSDTTTNAYYRLLFAEADLKSIGSGVYSGVITVVVQPE